MTNAANRNPGPNIVLIMVDQMRFDCLGAVGHPVVRTPNLDALARRGVRFASAYTPTVPCAPARASIFTGRYPDTHGLVGGRSDHLDPPDVAVLPELLQAAGCETALVGKLHLKPMSRRYGFGHFLRSDSFWTIYDPDEPRDSAYVKWLTDTLGGDRARDIVRRFDADELAYDADEVRFLLGTNVVDEEHHPTPWTAREAAALLRAEHERPFFLNCSFFGPHQPYLCPGRWGTMYPSQEIPLPPDFHVEFEDKPIFRGFPFLSAQTARRRRAGWDEGTYRKVLSAYYGNISMIDHYLGEVFEALDERALWDRTIVIFTSDHGDYGGQFGCFYKSLGYEGSAHVPLIVYDPRTPDPGRVEERTVSTIDLFATALSAAGAAVPPDTESRDLTGLLAGTERTWDNRAWFKQGQHSMLVRGRHKLMRGPAGEAAAYELYDLAESPMESVNRIDDPRQSAVAASMRRELDSWHARQERMRCRKQDDRT